MTGVATVSSFVRSANPAEDIRFGIIPEEVISNITADPALSRSPALETRLGKTTIQLVSRFFTNEGAGLLARGECIWEEVQRHLDAGTLNGDNSQKYVQEAKKILDNLINRLKKLETSLRDTNHEKESTSVGVLIHRVRNRHAAFQGYLEIFVELLTNNPEDLSEARSRFTWERLIDPLPINEKNFLKLIFGAHHALPYSTFRDASEKIFGSAILGTGAASLPESVSLKVEIDSDWAGQYPRHLKTVAELLDQLIPNAVQALVTERPGSVRVNIYPDGEELVISVTDNGRGIDPQIAHRLGALGVSTKSPSGDRGHGLYLIRRIAGHEGGSFGWNSILGGGTTMKVRLPLGSITT